VQATRSVWLNLQRESEPAPQLERAALSLSPLVTQIVHNRGISAEELPAFLHPDLSTLPSPRLLRGMDAAVSRIRCAIQAGELVAVYGDFDVDGITGAAVLVQALTLSGARNPLYPT
jgi:single-stranded-DNA-specific exonuclease